MIKLKWERRPSRVPLSVYLGLSLIDVHRFTINSLTVVLVLVTIAPSSSATDLKSVHLDIQIPSYLTNISTSDNISNAIRHPVASTPAPVSCEVARIKCALRQGCGRALQSYMLDCADLMDRRINYCDEFCEASLIALTSTEVGESLMDCQCSDDFCREKKSRVEICRERVLKAKGKDAVVSCSVAHLICTADTSCATALEFYDEHCRRMFMGRICSFRCNNSIAILRRQEKAAKLETCVCDGTESFDCFGIKDNMARLCFPKAVEADIEKEEEETNKISDNTAINTNNNNSTATSGTCRSFPNFSHQYYCYHLCFNVLVILLLWQVPVTSIIRIFCS